MPNIRTAAIAALLCLVTACGAEGPGSSPTSPAGNLGGDRLAVQSAAEPIPHMSEPVTGTVYLDDRGCWFIDLGDTRRVLVFPTGFTGSPGLPNAMIGPEVVVTDGMRVDGLGAAVSVSVFPGFPDGFWGSHLDFCDSGALEAAVRDTLEAAFDPDSRTVAAWVDMLRAADFTVSWECGYQFAVSTPDQQISLVFGSTSGDDGMQSPASVGDPNVYVWVTIGKYLMAYNCNDAVESWLADRTEVARWPLSAGTATFTVPVTSGCAGSEEVIARLTGLIVETPSGDVPIADIDAVNGAWGCFAA